MLGPELQLVPWSEIQPLLRLREPAANADTAAPSIAPTLPSAAAAPAAKASNAKPDALGGTPTNRPGEADKNGDSAADLGQSQEDRNAAHVDVYVSRTSDADAPRNVVVNIRAVNEGRRDRKSVV